MQVTKKTIKMKLKEVAFSMNLSLATVKRLQQSAQKHLKLSLEKQGIVAWGLVITKSLGASGVKTSPLLKIKERLASAVPGTAAKAGLAAVGMTGMVCVGAMTGKAPAVSSVHVNLNSSLSTAAIRIAAETPLPIEKVQVLDEDGEALPVSKNEDGSYIAEAEYNGFYRIILRATNSKTALSSVSVTGLDETGPEVMEIAEVNGRLVTHFRDDDSGLNFKKLYYETSDGRIVHPESVESSDSSAVFPLPDQSSILFYQDRAGNRSQTPIHFQ